MNVHERAIAKIELYITAVDMQMAQKSLPWWNNMKVQSRGKSSFSM